MPTLLVPGSASPGSSVPGCGDPGFPVPPGPADYYVTLDTDQEITGAKTFAPGVTVGDGGNVTLGTGTGTQFGTAGGAGGQKLSFYGAPPVTQPLLATGAGHTADDIITVLQSLGLVRQS